jgi:hypothetical protein
MRSAEYPVREGNCMAISPGDSTKNAPNAVDDSELDTISGGDAAAEKLGEQMQKLADDTPPPPP